MMDLPPDLAELLGSEPALARAYVVGGGVRDALLGLAPKDHDVEVFGVSPEDLAGALGRRGRLDAVGRSFGVLKLTSPAGHDYDFSLPRLDSRPPEGRGHRGILPTVDPTLTLPEAAARRDFTINSIYYDPRRREIVDPCGGREDLTRRVLRYTGPAFTEDPLRVLRGMQLCGRFGLQADPGTLGLCRQIVGELADLSRERVREEWLKWAGKSFHPAAGLDFLRESGWLSHFPLLDRLEGTPQDPHFHPEGDVWQHTRFCTEALARDPAWRGLPEAERAIYMMAILCHDLAKPDCTEVRLRGEKEPLVRGVEATRVFPWQDWPPEPDRRPRITSHGHEAASGPLARAFLEGLGVPEKFIARVVPLVENHFDLVLGTWTAGCATTKPHHTWQHRQAATATAAVTTRAAASTKSSSGRWPPWPPSPAKRMNRSAATWA